MKKIIEWYYKTPEFIRILFWMFMGIMLHGLFLG